MPDGPTGQENTFVPRKETTGKDSKPPLGKIIDMNQKERERASALESVPHKTVEAYPLLHTAFKVATQELNKIRADLGLGPIDFKPGDVRLVDPDTFKQVLFNTSQDAKGFLDKFTGRIYLEFDEGEYLGNLSERIIQAYAVIHELTHKSMNFGLNNFSFDLDEGITDEFASHIVRKNFANIFGFDRPDPVGFLQRTKPQVEGRQLEPDDVLYIGPERGFGFSRIPQMHMVRALRDSNPVAYQKLIEFAFRADSQEASFQARPFIHDLYGTEVTDMLQRGAKPAEVIEQLQKPK